MKYLYGLLLSVVSLIGLVSCHKADNYYYNFKQEEQMFDAVIYDYLMQQPGIYDSLAIVLERLPSLKSKLSDKNKHLTFFAANNRSFSLAIANLNNARRHRDLAPMYLSDISVDILEVLMHRYVFDKPYKVADFETYLDGRSLNSSKFDYEMHVFYMLLSSSGLEQGGRQQLVFSDVNNSIYQRYWNSTTTETVNFNTQNGVIHTLTARHEFAFGKLVSY